MIELTFTRDNKSYKLMYIPPASHWWLCNEEGEGMGIDQITIFEIFNKFFTENF